MRLSDNLDTENGRRDSDRQVPACHTDLVFRGFRIARHAKRDLPGRGGCPCESCLDAPVSKFPRSTDTRVILSSEVPFAVAVTDLPGSVRIFEGSTDRISILSTGFCGPVFAQVLHQPQMKGRQRIMQGR